MATVAVRNTAEETLVGMGQIATGQATERMKAVLGSCIGLAIYHARLKVGAMAHIVLPESAGRSNTPGKFADTAVPEMLKQLMEWGAPDHGLTAKFCGGSNMFGGSGPLQIGDANAKAVTRALKSAGIEATAVEVGGSRGRRVIFDCASGEMAVQYAGQPAHIL